MNSKEKAIELAYVKLIGQEKFDAIKKFVDENGYTDFDNLPDDLSMDDVKLRRGYDPSNDYRKIIAQPVLLAGIENNLGLTAILSEKDLPSGDSHTLFETCIGGKNVGYLVDADLIKENHKKVNITHFKKFELTPNPIH